MSVFPRVSVRMFKVVNAWTKEELESNYVIFNEPSDRRREREYALYD